VSQHLRVLRDAGLVREHVVGRERYYHLLADGLREAAEWIGRYERFWATHLDQLHTYLDREAEDNR
jgi:DNA-binding transcriptional ArsR family regulator